MAAGTRSGGDEGLSLSTLVIAALASAAAAVLVAQFSESGSAMAAALMAIFVPLLREAFHRPAKALSEARPRRRGQGPMAAAAVGTGAAVGAGHRSGSGLPTEATTAASGTADAGAGRADADALTPPVRGYEHGGDEATLFSGGTGVPDDMLQRGEDDRPDHGPFAGDQTRRIDDETRRLESGSSLDDRTRRLETNGHSPDDATRRLDPSTRRLSDDEDDFASETETRALGAAGALGGAGLAGRSPGVRDARVSPGRERCLQLS